jgi:flagellar protein FlaG
MVNPLTSMTGSVPIALTGLDLERPAVAPEPAVKVTATAEAFSTSSSTDANRQNTLDSKNPLEKALELVNSNMKAWSTGMRFNVDPEAQLVVVSIIDNETGEVLRTVPSDAVIRVAKMIVQLQGQSVNTKA